MGGIRSTGLTGSSGIGEYVGDLHASLDTGVPPPLPVDGAAPDGLLGITEALGSPAPHEPRGRGALPPVPSLGELADDYNERGDGTVALHGRRQVVTHPISSFGMKTYRSNQAASE